MISGEFNYRDSRSTVSNLTERASEKRSGNVCQTSTPLELCQERIRECRDILSNSETFEDLAQKFSHSSIAVNGAPTLNLLAISDQEVSNFGIANFQFLDTGHPNSHPITEQKIPPYPSFDGKGSSTVSEGSEAYLSIDHEGMCYFVHTEPTLCHELPTLDCDDSRWARVGFSPGRQVTITDPQLIKPHAEGLEAKVETWLDKMHPLSPYFPMYQPIAMQTYPSPFEERYQFAHRLISDVLQDQEP
jgi:hypothetical protein